MTESLLPSNTSNRFKFIVTSTRGKNLRPPSHKRVQRVRVKHLE